MASSNDDIFRKIHTIAEISALINSSLDIREVLNNSLAAVEQFIEVETSSFFELDTTCGELFFRCARGREGEKIRELRLKLGEGIAGYVAQTEKPVISTDAPHDPRFLSSFDDLTGFTTKSILCVPLKAKNRLIGVLELLNKRDGTDFDEEDLYIMSILANQIGIALENARLYKKLHEKLLLTVEELKFTQSKLFQSERLAALGKLAQGVAHEVRNPVAIIGGMAQLLEKRMLVTDPGLDLLREIAAAASRLERMVREVEAFTRLPTPSLISTDISRVIQNALTAFAEQITSRGVSLEAMPAGGKLSLAVGLEAKSVKITLQDTGTGIPADILPLVFDPFFSTKPHGTGMGLTIAHRIISEHRGEVRLCSTPGGGATVDLWLPRWPAE